MAKLLRALILEDSEDDTALVVRELQKGGYEVTSERVETAEAMRAALDRQEWDVVLADYSMPHFSAPAGLALLHEKGLDIPFIIVSGTIGEDVAVVSMKGGAHDYLFKHNLKRLGAAIEREIGQAKVRQKRRDAQMRIQHLNAVLRAIRTVNQLVVREKDPDTLLVRACQAFIETRGYYSAWIALLDESDKAVATAEAGLGKSFQPLAEKLERGELSHCARQALKQSSPVVIPDPAATCTDCPLAKMCAGRGAATARLEHAGKVYGLVSVSTSREMVTDEEEVELFGEVASDIAFALHNIAVEQERKQAEQKLADSEERHRLLAENAADVIWTTDINLKFTYFSPSISRQRGYTPEETMAQTMEETLTPESYELAMRTLQEELALEKQGTGDPHRFRALELQEKCKDGSTIWVEERMSFLRDKEGRPIGIHGVSRDITQRKQAEEALRKSQQQLNAMLQSIGDHMSMMDKDLNILWANETARRIFGDDIVGKKCYQVYHKRKAPCEPYPCPTLQAFQDGKTHQHDSTVLTKEGKKVYWHSTANVALRDEQGRPTAVLGVSRDTSERLKAEREISALLQLYDSTLASLVSGLLVLDDELNVTLANKVFLKQQARGTSDVVGKPITEVLPAPLLEEHSLLERIKRVALQGGEDELLRLRYTTDDSPARYLNVRIRAIRLAGETNHEKQQTQVLVNLHDVTEQHVLEEQMRQAQKMQAVGQLAGGVAHDFNNLLTGIIGYSNLVAKEFPPTDPRARDIIQIRTLGERAAHLTRQLLTFSRRQPLEMQVLNLNTTVKEVSRMLQRVIGENIELQLSPAADLGNVRADVGQLGQVLLNLALNARDAMPEGGKLIIETANVQIDQTYSHNHLDVRPGAYIMLTVSDTGEGMNEATRQRIFEPFFTTKKAGAGSGLGLSIAYGIVKQHGGNIWCYSEPGKGTTFKVYLPRAWEGVEPGTSPEAVELSGGSETILLTEDDDAVCTLAQRLLEAHGYKVLLARDPDEAETIFATQNKEIALLLTDIIMPKRSGPELYERLKAVRPDLKVLYSSGYADNILVHHGVLESRIALLPKPFTEEALLKKVREILDAK